MKQPTGDLNLKISFWLVIFFFIFFNLKYDEHKVILDFLNNYLSVGFFCNMGYLKYFHICIDFIDYDHVSYR